MGESLRTIVVYGSAARPGTTNPGDIDVAHTGPRDALAEETVRRWAATRGLGHLPVDWHPARVHDDTVHLPAPCGIEGHHEVLIGDLPVQWSPVFGLAACVRAYGDDSGRLREELQAGKWWRLAVIPGPGKRERDYVTGLTALRSALRKRPAAAGEVLFEEWPLLERLAVEDPQPRAETLELMRQGSPWAGSGEVSIVLIPGQEPRMQYPVEGAGQVTSGMLWPGTRTREFVKKDRTGPWQDQERRVLELAPDGRVSWRIWVGEHEDYGGDTFDERGWKRYRRAAAELVAGGWEELPDLPS